MTARWQGECQGSFLRSGVDASTRWEKSREKGIAGRGNSMSQAPAVVSGIAQEVRGRGREQWKCEWRGWVVPDTCCVEFDLYSRNNS